jgi:hypothetical protein
MRELPCCNIGLTDRCALFGDLALDTWHSSPVSTSRKPATSSVKAAYPGSQRIRSLEWLGTSPSSFSVSAGRCGSADAGPRMPIDEQPSAARGRAHRNWESGRGAEGYQPRLRASPIADGITGDPVAAPPSSDQPAKDTKTLKGGFLIRLKLLETCLKTVKDFLFTLFAYGHSSRGSNHG